LQLTEKNGYIFKKAQKSKDFKKKFYKISEGIIFSVKKDKNFSHQIIKKEISPLNLINLKENVELDYPYSFEIMCPTKQKPITFLTDCQKSQQEWCSTIKNNIEIMLSKSTKYHGNILKEENKQEEDIKLSIENKEKMISKIFKNNYCADCNSNEPCWISLNLCVLLCLECSGIHRKLGPNISKIRSLKLDNLNLEIIEIFYECGTSSVNQIWEANAINYMHLKPNPNSKFDFKEKWIKRKYVDKEFLKKPNGIY